MNRGNEIEFDWKIYLHFTRISMGKHYYKNCIFMDASESQWKSINLITLFSGAVTSNRLPRYVYNHRLLLCSQCYPHPRIPQFSITPQDFTAAGTTIRNSHIGKGLQCPSTEWRNSRIKDTAIQGVRKNCQSHFSSHTY